MPWYTSYRQSFALLQVSECHVVSKDPIQEQRIPGEDELMMYTIGAEWLCQKTCSICVNYISPSISWPYCKHLECDLTIIDLI